MSGNNFLTPVEIAKSLVTVGENKSCLPVWKMLILGVLAGCYIGFGAHLATTIGTGTFEYYGFKRFLMGAVFSVGLMLVIIVGAELFTGNNLMSVGLCSGRVKFGGLMCNWVWVYIGNLIGSILLAFIIAYSSGLLNGPVGGSAIDIAVAKTSGAQIEHLNHNVAFFFRAIACNWLVCLAVMMALAAKDVVGKIFACFFPIMAFVASGFEHSIANMYFIPAGIFAKSFPKAVEFATAHNLDGLNWTTMWTNNLISVTFGNIVGGAIFVGILYFFAYVVGTDACGCASKKPTDK